MRIFIEGENYDIDLLKRTLGEKFYISQSTFGVIDHVGYFYSKDDEVIYLLPKIFIDANGKLFGKYDKESFASSDINQQIDVEEDLNWLNRFLIIFYRSLIEYRRRLAETSILTEEKYHQLNTSIGNNEYTFLDLVLSIINFHKKNRNIILYKHKENTSQKHDKVNWTKTVIKSNPIFSADQTPIYTQLKNKRKFIDTEEELLSIFYSVLFHLKSEYNIQIKIDAAFDIYKTHKFSDLCRKAPAILRRIRYKYFNDTLVKMYKLLEIFFNKYNTSSYRKAKEEFIMVNNYHLIFEDMVDKLFSDNLEDIQTARHISLKKLKEQRDGKVIDHIFEFESLIDRDESIFYIGDSKYYKSSNNIGDQSIYKQFTYAKNVIQFNIDLLNENKHINNKLRYRDDATEGYNITPNFFIQGKLYSDFSYDHHRLEVDQGKGENGVEYSYHFKNRIFDRDSLFIHYYSINFLFVLNNYTKASVNDILLFRESARVDFRRNLVNYITNDSNIVFYKKEFATAEDLEDFVNKDFRKLIGKIYRTRNKGNILILAIDNQFDEDGAVNSDYINSHEFKLFTINDNETAPE